jgi:hypothetical protein
MTDPPNLDDPDCEPTDEQLTGLAVRAFAGVRAEHELSLQKLRAEIAAAREDVLRALAKREAGRNAT